MIPQKLRDEKQGDIAETQDLFLTNTVQNFEMAVVV